MLAMEGAPEYREKLQRGSSVSSGQSPVSTEFIGRFRGVISGHEIAFMQAFARREMVGYGYALEPIEFSLSDWLRFSLFEGPVNLLRMVAWRTREAIQHSFPAKFGRRPGRNMIIKDREPTASRLQTA
jgi:hypothetical protein